MKLLIVLVCIFAVLVAVKTDECHQPKVPSCLPALAIYLQSQETLLKKVENALKTTKLELKQAQQALATKASSSDLTNVRNELQKTKQELQQVKQGIGKWPAGSYCILASGSCPPGFTLKSGHMRAIKLYGPSASYIVPVTFGSSTIKCHGQPCGRYGQWIGELNIKACCK